MDRRSSIKALLIISAGAVLAPSCMEEKDKNTSSFKNLKINNSDEELLAQVTETIIPKTDTPGAQDVSAHAFVLMMMDDCYPPDTQNKFVNGMKEFETFTKKKFDKSFAKCSPAERVEIVSIVESKNGIPENVAFFYSSVKKLTLQAYTTSEYYLTKVHEYKLVPGKFYGCVPVTRVS